MRASSGHRRTGKSGDLAKQERNRPTRAETKSASTATVDRPVVDEQDVASSVAAIAIADAAETAGGSNGATVAEPTTEELAKVEADAAEAKAGQNLDGELIEDPVRMYLREIGRVNLLTAADERRLAQALASGKHVDRLEQNIAAETGRPASAADLVHTFLSRIRESNTLVEALAEYMAIEDTMTLKVLLTDESLRAGIDGLLDVDMLEAFGQRWSKEPLEVAQEIIQLSLNSHVHLCDLVDPPGHHACHCRPRTDDPHPGPHD